MTGGCPPRQKGLPQGGQPPVTAKRLPTPANAQLIETVRRVQLDVSARGLFEVDRDNTVRRDQDVRNGELAVDVRAQADRSPCPSHAAALRRGQCCRNYHIQTRRANRSGGSNYSALSVAAQQLALKKAPVPNDAELKVRWHSD